MKRLLIVSEPGCYGVFIYVRNLVRHLHAHHPEIVVDLAYSSRRDSPELIPFVTEVEARGGVVVDLGVSNAPEPADISALRALRALIHRRRPEVIHAHSSKAGALVRLLKMLSGAVPVLYTPHGYYGMSRRGGIKDRLFNGIETMLGWVGWTHNISIHEREFARRQLAIPSRSLLLIFSGVDLSVFRPATPGEKPAARRELGLPSEGRLLVTVGRDAYEKNYADLYRALDQVLPGSNVHFAHAGGGSDALRARLHSAAQERTHVFSFLERPELLYRAADGFVLPSRSEAFGLSAYEALACGLPLMLASTTGLLSLRKLNFPGVRWLPNPADAGDISSFIAESIREWAAAPASDGGANQEQVRQWFDARVQFEKLMRVYAQLAAHGGGDAAALSDALPDEARSGNVTPS